MGRIVVTEFISLDGVIEDPGGSESHPHGGWSFVDDRSGEGQSYKYDELMAASAHLLGRVTYQGFAAAWPTMEGTGEFGERMNGLPKYVVSSTLTPETATWQGTTIVSGDAAEQLRAAKARHEGDLLVAGSATLAQSLSANQLVDEYHLMVFPVVLGEGKRLFPEGAPYQRLRVVEQRTVGAVGVQILHYQPIPDTD